MEALMFNQFGAIIGPVARCRTMELWQDVRYGFRQLLGQPSTSVVAVSTLALGIAVSTALFSIVHATMLRPLPYPNPEQLVTLDAEQIAGDGSTSRLTPSMEDMRTWQAARDVFAVVAGWGQAFRGRIVDGPSPQRLSVRHFTEDYLRLYGVTPILGRGFSREDCNAGSPLVALLGYAYWQREYGGRNDVLGTTIRLDDEVATIVGVLPAWFHAKTPVSIPLRIRDAEFSWRGTGRVQVEARLQPGISVEAGQTRLASRPLDNARNGRARTVVTSQLDATTSRYRPTIVVFVAAVALIVLLACVNVAGLLLARGAARQRELGVRASLGATRRRLVRQLLTESFILAVPSAVIGVGLAWLSLDVIVANVPLTLPANSPISVNGTVLASTAALLVIVAIVSGLWPAFRLSRATTDALMLRAYHPGSSLSRRGGQLLIGAEIALAVVLVAGAGLMLRSFQKISAVDLGFEPAGLVTMQVQPVAASPAAHQAYYQMLTQQLRSIPSVSSVAIVDNFVLGGGTTYSSVSTPTRKVSSTVFEITPGYFETIRARLLEGRFLSDHDYASTFPGVVINESAARALFPGDGAVGREITRTRTAPPWVVLGVIADLRHGGPLNERGRGLPQVFFPFQRTDINLQNPMTVVIRTLDDPSAVIDQMREFAQSSGPRAVVERIQTAETSFVERVITPWRRTVLLALLGTFALGLALVGVFATTAFAVARRTAEIGVRMAIGARPAQVVRTILRDSAAPVVLGTGVGLVAASMTTRIVQSFLFETSPTDPLTLASVAAVLVATGVLAAFIPALRAARVDPVRTLRAE
jgi:putative ABC transport system permease protein